ncbi:RND transporter [Aquabacterium fontiphilum]|jgi:Cu/Ag efflux protein CusF|uniref:copper-binding protein n=1 Tax=Aquabacterium fontiphilum TaxID=450365 RepID=UPI001376C1B5|nr:copper-binding protein [Aquabacterium fontiphilum]NBD21235.1 RND transporter [Aquabacterium fontiphilum]
MKTMTWRSLAGALAMTVALAAQAQDVDGEVRKVDVEGGKVTVRHGEIKNLDMPPMQMSFRVSNPDWLRSLQPGDKIRFSADKVNGQFTITALEVRK